MASNLPQGPPVALVTGGAQGIGRASCLALVKAGYKVVCADVADSYGKTLVEAAANTGQCEKPLSFIHCDVRSNVDVTSAVALAIELATSHSPPGRFQCLFNNVGIEPESSCVPLHELEEDVWDQVLDVNLKSAFRMCKAALPHLIKFRGACVINNCSVQGLQSQVRLPAYAASKGGLLSLTRQITCDYGRYGLRCNSISPGAIRTEAFARSPTDDAAFIERGTPLNSVGMPEDIGDVVVWLASEQSRHITGQNIVVDGGMSITGGWASLELDSGTVEEPETKKAKT